MQYDVIATPTSAKRVPWNKGKLTGAKPPLRPNMSRRSGRSSRSKVEFATSRCSIWRSTVSFAAATLSPYGSRMSPPAATRLIAQRFDKRKLVDLSDLN